MSDSEGGTIDVSSRFNKEDADVILISNDEVHFYVHKKDLNYHSQFFQDLFELGENTETGRPEIYLDENAAILEIGLIYCYSGSKGHLEVGNTDMMDLITFFDKYQIAEGLDAVRESFFVALGALPGNLSYRLFASVFAKRYGYESLYKRAMEGLYKETTRSDLAILKSSGFDSYRYEATLVGFFLSSRLIEFNALKSKKLQRLFNLSTLSQYGASTALKLIGDFESYADYVNLASIKPDGLVGNHGSSALNTGYEKAITELQTELKALEMKF